MNRAKVFCITRQKAVCQHRFADGQHRSGGDPQGPRSADRAGFPRCGAAKIDVARSIDRATCHAERTRTSKVHIAVGGQRACLYAQRTTCGDSQRPINCGDALVNQFSRARDASSGAQGARCARSEGQCGVVLNSIRARIRAFTVEFEMRIARYCYAIGIVEATCPTDIAGVRVVPVECALVVVAGQCCQTDCRARGCKVHVMHALVSQCRARRYRQRCILVDRALVKGLSLKTRSARCQRGHRARQQIQRTCSAYCGVLQIELSRHV